MANTGKTAAVLRDTNDECIVSTTYMFDEIFIFVTAFPGRDKLIKPNDAAGCNVLPSPNPHQVKKACNRHKASEVPGVLVGRHDPCRDLPPARTKNPF